MCNEDDGLTEFFAQTEEQSMNFLLGGAVQVAGRLVGQQHGGPVHQRTGDCHPLLLAARELRWLVGEPFGQSHHGEQLPGRLTGFLFAPTRYQGRYHYILLGSEFRKQVVGLEDETQLPAAKGRELFLRHSQHRRPVYFQTARVRSHQGAQYLQQCGFTRPGSTHDGYYLALRGLEIHTVEHLQSAERLLYTLCFQYHGLSPKAGLVGMKGLEPSTLCSQSRCASQLRHIP